MIKQLSSDEFNLTHILTNNLQSVQAKKIKKRERKGKKKIHYQEIPVVDHQ